MQLKDFFKDKEKGELISLYKRLYKQTGDILHKDDNAFLREDIGKAILCGQLQRGVFGLNPVIKNMQTAVIASEEIGVKRASVLGIMLHDCVGNDELSIEYVRTRYGEDVAGIIHGLKRVHDLYDKTPSIETENFRNLLLSFAEDMRVILIMIADRVNIMRQIKDSENEEARLQIAGEAAYLYAPLAHKLGLYKLKSELEDLSLKYTEHDIYYHIKEKLNETKASRDLYITRFIEPIRQKLEQSGLKFHIKGRTKSIHSIYQKMKKQKCPFEGVYDLFAIRIILDSPADKEKIECWQAFSVVTDMYQPNPKRLRDWLSVPKSNGYESLHITVMGPEGKWVEVQIRTERMDDIAEHGLAAHWRYKGVKGENGLDEWLASVREALENNDGQGGMEAMDQFKLDLYEDEVFVFTPKGDLFKLPKGATVLDFAFHIHTRLGCKCIGARVNGRNAQLRQKLHSGDQVEIMTSAAQSPKQDWLNIVTTSKARTKIKQALKELAASQYAIAREDFDRKLKNRKIEYSEPTMMRLIMRLGYKVVTDFFQAIAEGRLDLNDIIDRYQEQQRRESEPAPEPVTRSAEGYNLTPTNTVDESKTKEDVLIIDQNLKGIDFKLAKCCNPIYGDEVFGFVSTAGGIKIHRNDCPNAHDMRQRFGYRIVKARWAGKANGTEYPITLHVVGNDDIGIVNNITSIISKELNIALRSISIDSHDGLFSGNLTIMIGDSVHLENVIRKLRTVKGVKQVSRLTS
ncbi:MAG: RelA/SpoT family protein [Bacteroidales bacterium]|nr:RelA/SpoT family protein [Bacteroidales bacterium]